MLNVSPARVFVGFAIVILPVSVIKKSLAQLPSGVNVPLTDPPRYGIVDWPPIKVLAEVSVAALLPRPKMLGQFVPSLVGHIQAPGGSVIDVPPTPEKTEVEVLTVAFDDPVFRRQKPILA